MTACPTREQLDLWINEQLASAEQADLAAHIDSCPHCQSALEQLTSEPSTPDGPATDARLSSILQRLKESAPTAPAQSSTDGDIPVILGYDLAEVLGRGGMGVVYRARQLGVNRTVAIKLLHRQTGDGEDAVRFRREGETLGRLQHPNIVQVYEVGVAAGRPFLVMEFVAGGPLSQVAAGRPLLPKTAADLVEQVARAVQHAHDHGVLHRDLKPGNILLDRPQSSTIAVDSGLGTPKVADFGLAKSIDGDSTITQTGVVVGTPSYMAPEQVVSGPLTPACDVYGLGAVFYELLTGRPPFIGANPADVLLQVRDQDPVSPSRLIPSLPRDLNTVCLKCLQKDPKRRYQSAWAVAEDLRRWRDGEPILARPTGSVERAWKWARRRKAAAALVGVALFLLVVGLPAVTGLWLWADVERRRADEAGKTTARALDRAERSLYSAHIAQAELQYRLNDPTRTRYHLHACEPSPGRPDLRGWEWYYLHGLAYSEHIDLTVPPPPDQRSRTWYSVTYDPNGRWIAAGGGVLNYLSYRGTEPGELAIWDVASGRLAVESPGLDPLAITGVAFGSDGRLFTVGTDVWFNSPRLFQLFAGGPTRWLGPTGLLRARDVRTGNILFERPFVPPVRESGIGHPEQPTLVVNRDGSRVVVGAGVGLTIFDGRSGERIRDCEGAFHAGFDHTGDELTVLAPATRWLGGRSRFMLTTHKAVDGQIVRSRLVNSPTPLVKAFSPTGRYFAWLMSEGEVALAQIRGEDEDRRFRLDGPTHQVSVIAISPDETLLATGGPDGTVRVWDLSTGRSRQVFRGHANRVLSVAFDPTGSKVVSVGWDRATKVWDLTRQPEFANVGGTPRPGERRVEDCVFTANGSRLLVIRAPSGDLEWWDTATDRRTSKETLDLTVDKLKVAFPGRMAAFSASGSRLAAASGSDPTVVKVWNIGSADNVPVKELRAFKGCREPIRSVAITPDGSRVAATGWIRRTPGPADLFVWDVDRKEELLHVALDGDACPALALSPDGKRLVAAIRPNVADDSAPACQIRVWEIASRRELVALDAGADVSALTFDAPGERLAVATYGPRVLIWNTESWTQLHAIPCLEPYVHLAFAPNGRRLAGATQELMTLWDPAAGKEVLTLRGKPRPARDLPFNPRVIFDATGTKVAVSQSDHTVHIWTAAGYPGK